MTQFYPVAQCTLQRDKGGGLLEPSDRNSFTEQVTLTAQTPFVPSAAATCRGANTNSVLLMGSHGVLLSEA